MAGTKTTTITKLSDLRLSVEEREQVAEVAGELIAVQVYRELQAQATARAASSGCNIIANCSSCSSKEALLAE